MQAFRTLALAAVLGAAVVPASLVFTPVAALAQQAPTKDQIKTAVKAAHPTIGQLRALKKIEPNINSMTPDQLKQALAQIFSPPQLSEIHQSLVAQGVSLP
jgi:hypothetical protein